MSDVSNLKDQFQQDWHSSVQSSSKCDFYKTFKTTHDFEPYLVQLRPTDRIALTRFRTRNHYFPIEIRSWSNVEKHLRKCPHFPNLLGDEFHYLFECIKYKSERKSLLGTQNLKPISMYKCDKIMSDRNTEIKFCKVIFRSETAQIL